MRRGRREGDDLLTGTGTSAVEKAVPAMGLRNHSIKCSDLAYPVLFTVKAAG